MHRRRNAQRKHIIQSFDSLLYQLHVVAFFLSPSIFTLIFRFLSQSQCSRQARELDSTWSLRAFFAFLIIPNAVVVWNHATSGSSDGPAVILDFIGMAYTPSKLQLVSLDLFIVFLQMVLAAIAFETSITKDEPTDISPAATPSSVLPDHSKPSPPSPYVVDLKLSAFIARIRTPVPPGSRSSVDGLPMPNTTPWPPGMSLRVLLGLPGTRRESNESGDGNETTRIPGALYG